MCLFLFLSRGSELFCQQLLVTPVLIALILSMTSREGVLRRKIVMPATVRIEEIMKGMINTTMKGYVAANLKESWRKPAMMH
jgi:hypothetical protein